MRNGLKWTLATLAFLLVAASVLWATSRYLGLGAADREALRLMREPWRPEGRNAFAAFWTLGRDMPEALQERVTAADMRAIAALQAGASPWVSYAPASGYPSLQHGDQDAALFCRASDSNCLARVQADVAGYRALVDRHAVSIARADALAGYDHFRTLLPAGPGVHALAFQGAYAPATRDALLFAQGQRQQAIGNVCRGIGTWRRFAGNNDHLLAGLIAAVYASDGYGRLFAEMLAQLPPGQALPASCDAALAEVRPDEPSLCRALRTEFAYSDSMTGRGAKAQQDGVWPPQDLFFDHQATRAMMARNFAPACSAAGAGQIARDARLDIAPPPAMRSRFVCLSNPTGCMLADIAAPAYSGHVWRMQDYGMKLRALAALRWLHDHPQPGRALDARLAQLPAYTRTPQRRVSADADGTRLVIALYDRTQERDWSLPVSR